MESLVEDTQLRQLLSENHLPRVPDFQRLAKKFQRRKATLQASNITVLNNCILKCLFKMTNVDRWFLYGFQDLYRVYQAVSKMGDLLDSVEQHTGEHRMLLMQLFSSPIKVSFWSAFSSQTSLKNISTRISFNTIHFVLLCFTFKYILNQELLMDFRKFQDMVEATMDLTKVDKFEYVVKPDFDDMLKSEYSSLWH